MLVLTRKLGEDVRIGDAVRITVLEVRGSQVKLGIEAPPEVKVHRGEIFERIQEENRRAAATNPAPNTPSAGEVADKPPPQTGGLPPTASRGLQRLALVIGGQPATAHS